MTGEPFDRREFFRRAALAGLGVGLSALPGRAPAAETPRVRRTVLLGRTGLEVSDIGFGSADLVDRVDVVHHALERGITYFDTAEMYADGEAERTLGKALGAHRKRVVLTSKVMAMPDFTKERCMQALEASLGRLNTDYVDIYFNHAVNDVARLANPEWHEFVELAKKQGKIRFSGMSGHGANLVACLDYAFEHEMVDVVLSAYNFAQDPTFYERLKIEAQQWLREGDFVATLQAVPATLAKGKAKGVGIVCMKTLRGARKHDLRPYEPGRATFAQAALRWVLSNPNVDVALITMPDPAHVDEYLLASGWTKPARGDLGLLQRYEDLHGAVQCRYGCNLCSESCPHEVAIPEVLRTLMYARDYERPQLARREYSRLGEGASACLSCAHHSCVGACPFGLAIDRLTTDAHRLLGSRG